MKHLRDMSTLEVEVIASAALLAVVVVLYLAFNMNFLCFSGLRCV
jgi:hypothetical protein